MPKFAPLLLAITGMFISLFSIAQETAAGEKVQMAEGLRSSGKIYVVVAVLLTILAGIVLYLIRLDKKISKLEKS